jgi:hypothetical protein
MAIRLNARSIASEGFEALESKFCLKLDATETNYEEHPTLKGMALRARAEVACTPGNSACGNADRNSGTDRAHLATNKG